MTDIPHILQNRVALLEPLPMRGEASIPQGTLGTCTNRQSDSTPIIRFAHADEHLVNADILATVHPAIDLPQNTDLAIPFCAIVGSRAHGLESDGSDTDRRGFYIPSSNIHFSLRTAPDQLINDADQLCFWEVKKFISLCLKANPTALETLFSPTVEFATPWANRLVEQRAAFLSKRAYQTFMGYADAQFTKMQRARDNGNVFKWRHAMHLIRLLHAGIDLVQTGNLDIVVPEDRREQLNAIKQGELDWHDVIALRHSLIKTFAEAFETTPLPDEPDYAAASAFLIDLRMAVAKGANA